MTEKIVTSLSIERMTVDLFEFWLNYDWGTIVEDLICMRIPTFDLPKLLEFTQSPPRSEHPMPSFMPSYMPSYMRNIYVFWAPKGTAGFPITGSLTTIAFAQMNTDRIRVEISSDGTFKDELLEAELLKWTNRRFGIKEETREAAQIQIRPLDDDLTKTEKLVASHLAQKRTYSEIAKLMDLKVGTIKTHANAISKKWGCRRVPEILWVEAQKRGYT